MEFCNSHFLKLIGTAIIILEYFFALNKLLIFLSLNNKSKYLIIILALFLSILSLFCFGKQMAIIKPMQPQ